MSRPAEADPAAFERRLDYTFRDRGLLLQALTRKSRICDGSAGETPAVGCYNERLEFLGDAVLELEVSRLLYLRHPEWDEGKLTRRRSQVVNSASLAAFARRLGLGRYLRLGRGEEKQRARQRAAVLADTFEALLAALYLDGAAGRAVVTRLVVELVELTEPDDLDAKSRLQELCQERHGVTPVYELVERSGRDHQPIFRVAVSVPGQQRLGEGRGGSLKKAEQAAAAAALKKLSCIL